MTTSRYKQERSVGSSSAIEITRKVPVRVAIIGIPPIRMMDMLGPAEVFVEANRQRKKPFYEMVFLSGGCDTLLSNQLSVSLLAQGTFHQAHQPFDTLLVAGGEGACSTTQDPVLLEWLRSQAHASRRFGSVCTGALVLGEAGLLDGRRATTHWHWCQELADRFPRAKVDSKPIFVRDGNCYTSAGVTAGIDLALALVEEDLGRGIALKVAQMMVVFLRRPGGQSQFSATLAAQGAERDSLGDLLAWLPENLRTDLSIDRLAKRAAMSPRNFARAFKSEVLCTPAQHIQALRLEVGRRLLESKRLSVEEIAEHAGFNSAEVFRRAFQRRMNVSPAAYRRTFGGSD